MFPGQSGVNAAVPSAEYPASPRRALLLAVVALAVALAALLSVTMLARGTFARLQRGSEARQHAYDVLLALRKVRQDIGEMRVGVTGFVVTHDSLYLATYRHGVNGLATDTATIRRLTEGAPSLQLRLDRMQPEVRRYAADLADALGRSERGASAAPPPAAIPSRSALLIESLRPQFVALEAEQQRLLDLGTIEVQRAVARTDAIFGWVVLVAALVILGTSALLFVHGRARARAEARLARTQEQLHESQRLEAVGRLAGGVAHDFNNILTVIIGCGELLEASLPADHPGRRDLAVLGDAARQGADLTAQLLAFGRRQVLELQVLDLNGVVKGFRPMLDRVIPENIEIVQRLADDLGHPEADRGQVEQILMNLAVNARDAMPGGGRLTIETANADFEDAANGEPLEGKPGRYVALIVSDTGTGMDEVTRARVFEPFFTTKELGKGSGLGLATVYGIVKQSGGHVWVYSEPSHGSTFKVYLPRVDAPATPGPRASVAESVTPTGTETILLVEDDDRVRDVTRRILVAAGYRVLPAARPEIALDLLARHAGRVDLLLSDVVMPGMSGPELARRALELVPGIRVLYQSGYSDAAIAPHGALEGGAALLAKPFTAGSLRRKVREVLDGVRAGV